MAKDKKRRNLGRGLSALLGEETASVVEEQDVSPVAESEASETATVVPFSSGNQKTVAISLLSPGKYQPRTNFEEEAIEGLADSIREKGILQPILVRPHPDRSGEYEIIAGERRWQASQKAQLHEVPVIVKEMDDRDAAEIALVENLQRQDLSPLEEAEGYNRLMDEFSHTQEALSKALGKSRSHVANMMRLLALPSDVKTYLEDGLISTGHARALLNCDEPAEIAKQIIKKGLNVRQTESLVKTAGVQARPKVKKEKDADTVLLERDLTDLLGVKVDIKVSNKGGALTLHYSTLEQLDDLLHRLSHGHHGKAEQEQDSDLDPVSEFDIEAELEKL
ncbi:Chromosome-partitioning protein ParB [Candidatus Terasakiella magnetica]|uniref:Chromosome-partitioning protein ParB n=1 Tax=Candidatus Terasakiella magnetica TaxID=1867952 RepID=A0A1C3RGH3_9PROT|nr:ParB/RepB/Spo0J family partition protein [Candidatus Terasakiella magnetica]SCA56361.1 Chromosome-partitioning protein ParB [Candidatus Terasakiella magnetica]